MAVEQIRILRIQGRPEGMELVTSALEKVSSATVKVTQAADGMTAATTAQSSKVLSLTKQWETYQARTDLAARAQQQFARDITSVTRFFEQGTIGASRYADEVERIKQSLQSAGGAGIIPKVDQSAVNASLGITAAVRNSARESASAFETEFARLEVIARQKAEQIGQNFQTGLNEYFGTGAIAKSARESASVFAAELDRMDQIAQQKATQIGQEFQARLNEHFGIGKGSSGAARASAAVFEEVAKAEEKMAAQAAALRTSIDPMGAEFGRLGAQLAEYRKLLNAGVISTHEFEQAQVLAGTRLTDFQANLKQGANAGRVMAGELVNLSYQLNDVVTGLALGQSPFMILGQQGGQVVQIFQNSKASVVDFAKEAGSRLLGYLTTTRLVFGGVVGAVAAAGFALSDYAAAQQKVAMSLTGAGRASGASITGINATAGAGASTFGLSVSEARNLAAALAATGKVANDNILPIVKMGKDIATAFGQDATEAAKMLAEAFSDPAKGAETLNQRLGFLDAAMQRNITNLMAQNKIWEAQRILAAGAATSLADVNAAVGTSTKFWTALGNVISNAWDKIGEGAARATGIGLKLGLDEQIENATKRVQELEAIASRRSTAANKALGTADLLEKERAKLDELTAAWSRYGQASIDAQQRQFSFAQAAGVRNQQPAIEQIEKLRNEQELLVRTMVDVQTTGGASSEILKRMGVSYEDLAKSLSIANTNMASFKSEFQSNLDQLKIANQAITAFSPGAKGDIARQQSIESTLQSKMTPEEKATLAQQAYNNAVKQSVTAISEAERARLLTSNQSVDAARLEIELVGKNIAQQNELRANLAAKQQLEQEASQNRTKFDEAQYERLKKINAELAKQKQLAAERQLGSDIKFERSQIGLSDTEQGINSRLRSIYGDDITSQQYKFYKQQLMINASLKDFMDTSKETLKGFASDFRSALANGATAWEAFQQAGVNALNKIADKLMNMAIDNLWANAFGGSSGGGFGGIGSLFGLGGGGVGNYGQVANATGLGAGTGGLSFPMFAGGTDFAPGGPAMINEVGGEIVNLPSGAQVIPHDVSMAMAANSNSATGVHVTVGAEFDDDGRFKVYVKNVSQKAVADGISGYVGSPAFVQHVATASTKGRARRLG